MSMQQTVEAWVKYTQVRDDNKMEWMMMDAVGNYQSRIIGLVYCVMCMGEHLETSPVKRDSDLYIDSLSVWERP